MSSVPRDPGHYHPSVHCVDRHKTRGIELADVAETIKSGEVKPTHKPGCKLFIKEFGYYDKPIGVVAEIETGKIVTIEYRKGE